MKFTRIPYQYRDGDNYKLHAELDCVGEITDEQRQALAESLDTPGDNFFIPEQVGLGHLLDDSEWGRSDNDHCWHELFIDEVEVLDTEEWKSAQPRLRIETVVEAFVKAGEEGWKDGEYGARFAE